MVTGTSADRSGKGGAVVFYDAKTHELVRRVAMPSSAVGLAWHERLNQIFVGVGAPFSKLNFFSRLGYSMSVRHSYRHAKRMLVCRLPVTCPSLAVASFLDSVCNCACTSSASCLAMA